ncbi:inorganic phosphate transporter [Pyrococcus yayanosii]|uniref:Sodium/phosphate symporter n=1 Tax=Pyrococcus yayanosii (strain CH1 / JCM 16557) TaxID=529709 RepID=F8AII9_PYRYC|nr:inorganic phosphate transporter [Pyrococcus yayanosii]AEH24355.1 Sodium/phosphate symporter [Pyrococcus yayanosii CH1]
MDTALVAALAVGFYIAWNIGANDSANAMGTAVGAGILNFRQATLTIGIFVILGAYLRGYKVMKTVGEGIISSMSMELAILILFSAGIWVTIATIKGLPVSTTQAIVGGVIGAGLATGATINWSVMEKVVGAWVLSPVIAGIFAALLYKFYSRIIASIKSLRRLELLYKWMAILGGSYMAFNFGANEVANATGPLVGADLLTPRWAGLFGAISLTLGSLTFSYAVMHTVGKKITSLGPVSAFSAQFSSAIAVSLANYFGLPVSSSQAIVGGVVGVGLAAGERVDKRIVADVLFGWVATPTTGMVIAFTLSKLFMAVGLL